VLGKLDYRFTSLRGRHFNSSSEDRSIVDQFNAHHPRLQFTVEIGGDRINFLDMTIIKSNKKLIFDWYHKPNYSDRYLSFLSRHPFSQERGMIIGLVDRMFMSSHPSFHQKNLELIIKILLENVTTYSISFLRPFLKEFDT